jgi:hypothetical protein
VGAGVCAQAASASAEADRAKYLNADMAYFLLILME